MRSWRLEPILSTGILPEADVEENIESIAPKAIVSHIPQISDAWKGAGRGNSQRKQKVKTHDLDGERQVDQSCVTDGRA